MGKEQKEVRFKRSPLTPYKPTWSESALAAKRHHQCPCEVLPSHVSVGLQVSESTFSSGADSVPSPSHLGPSRTLTARKTVEVANKGIQAGQCGLLRLDLASFLMDDALCG